MSAAGPSSLCAEPAAGVAPRLRPAQPEDLSALCRLEAQAFASDRLSRRRMRHWISADNGCLHVATGADGTLLGYALALLRPGTRMARLYSLAVDDRARGLGLGARLVEALEHECAHRGRLYMRLEVAPSNAPAIALYRRLGYRSFGRWTDYYEDHQDALRMQKPIRPLPPAPGLRPLPWYGQSTEFTCGPAALLMAMAALAPGRDCTQAEELALWREATTIFMTSGHGGCHPVGLALAAQRRGFVAEAWLNTREPLFVDGVRREDKKAVIRAVHTQFLADAEASGLAVHCGELETADLAARLQQGWLAVALISTWRLDRRKAPHWVLLSAADAECFYIHDPDPPEDEGVPLDHEYLPIAREDFARMSRFGSQRLRTLLLLGAPTGGSTA